MSHSHKHQRTSKRSQTAANGEIPMTPMIDIVFQLLIYFLITFEPVDVMAHLDVFTPSPEEQRKELETPPNMIRITVYANGFTINERRVDKVGLERILSRLGAIKKTQTVLIMATALSPHKSLVDVLDLCAKADLRNLSVVSTN